MLQYWLTLKSKGKYYNLKGELITAILEGLYAKKVSSACVQWCIFTMWNNWYTKGGIHFLQLPLDGSIKYHGSFNTVILTVHGGHTLYFITASLKAVVKMQAHTMTAVIKWAAGKSHCSYHHHWGVTKGLLLHHPPSPPLGANCFSYNCYSSKCSEAFYLFILNES